MTDKLSIGFSQAAPVKKGTVIILAGADLVLGPQASHWSDAVKKAAQVKSFSGERTGSLELVTPAAADGIDRLVVAGLGKLDDLAEEDWTKLGGELFNLLPKEGEATIFLERPDGAALDADLCAGVALGLKLRSYSFDKYKTVEKPKKPKKRSASFAVAEPAAVKKAWAAQKAVAEGVDLARDLVNEPANHLGPVEFADRLRELEKLGVEVNVLDEKALRKHKMGALLGVAQGSERPPRLVSLAWNGGRAKDRPIAFVGKGVVFDTGGISIKPAAGMEDMKGDMGGAAAVSGLFHVLATRKSKANVVGVVGLVENMPDGRAQRPGDIVTSMSGQTIEVINTDAEGRLVLADALTYVQETFKPTAIVDLATLTGAIIVALGHHYAGMFSSDDTLAERLTRAGESVGDKVWRMPIGPEYDKLIDSKNADMKNVGGRWGGAVAAAQFLKRFVKDDTPWAHIDLAGTAMGSPATSINASWGSGYGVRLLDRLVRDDYEK